MLPAARDDYGLIQNRGGFQLREGREGIKDYFEAVVAELEGKLPKNASSRDTKLLAIKALEMTLAKEKTTCPPTTAEVIDRALAILKTYPLAIIFGLVGMQKWTEKPADADESESSDDISGDSLAKNSTINLVICICAAVLSIASAVQFGCHFVDGLSHSNKLEGLNKNLTKFWNTGLESLAAFFFAGMVMPCGEAAEACTTIATWIAANINPAAIFVGLFHSGVNSIKGVSGALSTTAAVTGYAGVALGLSQVVTKLSPEAKGISLFIAAFFILATGAWVTYQACREGRSFWAGHQAARRMDEVGFGHGRGNVQEIDDAPKPGCFPCCKPR